MVDSVAEIGTSGPSCHIGVSNSTPVLLPPLQDSASYGSGQNAGGQVGWGWTVAATKVDKVPVGFADVMESRVEAGIRAGRPLSLRPRPPMAAWAQPRTGMPDAEGRRSPRHPLGTGQRRPPPELPWKLTPSSEKKLLPITHEVQHQRRMSRLSSTSLDSTASRIGCPHPLSSI